MMVRWGRAAVLLLVVAAAAAFTLLNGSERVTVQLGVTTMYRISLVGLVMGAFLLGMVTMFLYGLRRDLLVRRRLRELEHGFRYPPARPSDPEPPAPPW